MGYTCHRHVIVMNCLFLMAQMAILRRFEPALEKFYSKTISKSLGCLLGWLYSENISSTTNVWYKSHKMEVESKHDHSCRLMRKATPQTNKQTNKILFYKVKASMVDFTGHKTSRYRENNSDNISSRTGHPFQSNHL